jgi:hypothetical protein
MDVRWRLFEHLPAEAVVEQLVQISIDDEWHFKMNEQFPIVKISLSNRSFKIGSLIDFCFLG